MDWELAIKRNREDLLKIVGMMFTAMSLIPGAVAATLPKSVYYAVQRILRPAESALRRLIFLRMRGLAVPEYEPRSKSKTNRKPRAGSGKRKPAFPLIDPR